MVFLLCGVCGKSCNNYAVLCVISKLVIILELFGSCLLVCMCACPCMRKSFVCYLISLSYSLNPFMPNEILQPYQLSESSSNIGVVWHLVSI